MLQHLKAWASVVGVIRYYTTEVAYLKQQLKSIALSIGFVKFTNI